MKLIKMLGLAAMAAMVAMAFVGVSSAMAEPDSIVLCKKAELICEEKDWWPNPTKIHAHAKEPKLLSSIGTIECELSLALLELLNLLDKLILGHLTELSFTGNCHLGGTACTVTVSSLGAISFTHDPEKLLLAHALAVTLGETDTVATVKCGFFINCTYKGEGALLTAHSSETGLLWLEANEAVLSKTSGICPSTSKWDAKYLAVGLEKLEPVTNLYIES
jgi:hypothetical protein